MPGKKLTDKKIVKALECCTTNGASCKDCPAFVKVDRSNCKKYFRGALDLINRLQSENKRLSVLAELGTKRADDYRVMRDRALKAEKEVERLKTNEERYNRLYHLLLDPLIVANGKNGELRPVKRTSRQDVYHTLLRAQEIMEIPYRWFPWKKDGDNK